MNDDNAKLFRLLKLFPVAVIRNQYDTEERIQLGMLSEIIETVDYQTIIDFCINNLTMTKQHIYCFGHNIPFRNLSQTNLFEIEPLSVVNENSQKISKYLFTQKYSVIVSSLDNGEIERLELEFFQPCILEFTNNSIIIRLTILERSPKSYLSGYEVLKYSREVEDEQLVEKFRESFKNEFGVELETKDLNRGVKHLWQNDMIDALSVKYKRETSMATEVMDEEYTFKEQNPIRFGELLLAPLRNHAFKFLINHEEYCDFVTDPTIGRISFNKYPTNENQINNVITEILNNN